ncbi:MAG: rod shape-determining protein RodA [Hyphomicrobiales bacterium]|nr:rod shape-determining protein RodA [Hyphomicrobiales bacterium]
MKEHTLRHRPNYGAWVFGQLRLLDGWLVVNVLLLGVVGILMQYSAAKGAMQPWALPQLLRFGAGFIVMLVIALISARGWFQLAYPLYALGILGLLLVELMGFIGMGAQRWIVIGGIIIQPSEFMKPCLILALAHYYHRVHHTQVMRWWLLLFPLGMIAVPAMLILHQPNLGTTVILCLTALGMMFVAGVGWRKFVLAGLLGLALLPVGWQMLHDYQKQRVWTFLAPETDPLGAGYNILQSKIAIGSGGILGKGFVQGSQSQLDFLPEKQTDFVFTMIAEEFGLIGALGVIALYAMILLLGVRIVVNSRSVFGKLVAAGVMVLLFVQVFVNIGMVSGVLPVVGVPLPLVSYGGSSLLATLIGLGLLLSVNIHREADIH